MASIILRRRGLLALERAANKTSSLRWFSAEVNKNSEENSDTNTDGKIDFGFTEVPREEKQTLVGQVFSSVAPSYDVMNDLMSGGLHRLWKDRLVESLAPFPGMKHLDVAGGTGDVAFRVYKTIRDAERLRDAAYRLSKPHATSTTTTTTTPPSFTQAADIGSVVVCDINASMLKEGERKAAAQGIDSASMQFIEGNAEGLPFPDDSFDSYTIAFGIRNVTDRMAALREARRVLRPGGRFLCLEFSKVVLPGLQQLYDLYSFNVIPAMGQFVANDSESYRYLVESIRMFPGQTEWAEMIRDAGFGVVEYENLTGGVVAIHSGINPASS
ncbi:hypothetical protein Ndes2526B_g00715 [Nannochloris sp. 'desiccata']|nr:putative 2-methoxy-6-polyprenyl-1,4-benzoquinol methylase, mitochondrial [Chlorella desiccata (nom. nud.)]